MAIRRVAIAVYSIQAINPGGSPLFLKRGHLSRPPTESWVVKHMSPCIMMLLPFGIRDVKT